MVDSQRPHLEVCADSLDAVMAAQRAGVDGVELCAALTEGGVTPSTGLVRAARRRAEGLELAVLIRPRGGDFLTSAPDLEAVRDDLSTVKNAGVDRVVLGFLGLDGAIDREATARAVEWASPLPVTFHRAFDLLEDPLDALDTLVALGISRVLTSGGAPSAPEGTAMLRRLVARATGRIGIMPGGGLRADNIARVWRETGASFLHFSASRIVASPMRSPPHQISLGKSSPPSGLERRVTDEATIRDFVSMLVSG